MRNKLNESKEEEEETETRLLFAVEMVYVVKKWKPQDKLDCSMVEPALTHSLVCVFNTLKRIEDTFVCKYKMFFSSIFLT